MESLNATSWIPVEDNSTTSVPQDAVEGVFGYRYVKYFPPLCVSIFQHNSSFQQIHVGASINRNRLVVLPSAFVILLLSFIWVKVCHSSKSSFSARVVPCLIAWRGPPLVSFPFTLVPFLSVLFLFLLTSSLLLLFPFLLF